MVRGERGKSLWRWWAREVLREICADRTEITSDRGIQAVILADVCFGVVVQDVLSDDSAVATDEFDTEAIILDIVTVDTMSIGAVRTWFSAFGVDWSNAMVLTCGDADSFRIARKDIIEDIPVMAGQGLGEMRRHARIVDVRPEENAVAIPLERISDGTHMVSVFSGDTRGTVAHDAVIFDGIFPREAEPKAKVAVVSVVITEDIATGEGSFEGDVGAEGGVVFFEQIVMGAEWVIEAIGTRKEEAVAPHTGVIAAEDIAVRASDDEETCGVGAHVAKAVDAFEFIADVVAATIVSGIVFE